MKVGVLAIPLEPEVIRRFTDLELYQDVKGERSILDEALDAYRILLSKVQKEWNLLSEEDKGFLKAITYSYLSDKNNFVKFYANLEKSTGVKLGFRDYFFIAKTVIKSTLSLFTPEGRYKAKLIYETFNKLIEEVLERVEEENEDLKANLRRASVELEQTYNQKVWSNVDEMMEELNKKFWEKYS